MNKSEILPAQHPAIQQSTRERVWSAVKLSGATLITTAVLVVLVWFPIDFGKHSAEAPKTEPAVRLVDENVVSIAPGSSIQQKLTSAYVATQRLSEPVLTVTASV